MNKNSDPKQNQLCDSELDDVTGGSFGRLGSVNMHLNPGKGGASTPVVRENSLAQSLPDHPVTFVPVAKPDVPHEPLYIPPRRKIKIEELL